MLKIRLVVFGTSIVCPGFRRISSVIKQEFSDVITYIYDVSGEMDGEINKQFLNEMADADIVGVSCTSQCAPYVYNLVINLSYRAKMPFIVWGGSHATVLPEDAIKFADVVCIGEGERSFSILLGKLSRKESIDDTKGFWINTPNGIIKNDSEPLLTGEELSEMPFQDFGFDIYYVNSSSISKLDLEQYELRQGSVHTVVWSLGCPYRCSYCSNDRFIINNAGNAKIRYPSPEHMIEELRSVLSVHKYFSHIAFTDDNFMLIKYEDIKLFCELYDKYIKLPFIVYGIHPLTIDVNKIAALVNVGLKKVRMGIQSGSEIALELYNRKTTRGRILKAVDYLAFLYPLIIPPFYDVIIDNPVETDKDKLSTIFLLYEMARPFCLSVYSLRTIPGTKLYDFAKKNPQYDFVPIKYGYEYIRDKGYGFLLYLIALWHPPLPILKMLITLSKSKYFLHFAFPIVHSLHAAKVIYWENKLYGYPWQQVISRVFNRVAYKSFHTGDMGIAGTSPEWTVRRLVS